MSHTTHTNAMGIGTFSKINSKNLKSGTGNQKKHSSRIFSGRKCFCGGW